MWSELFFTPSKYKSGRVLRSEPSALGTAQAAALNLSLAIARSTKADGPGPRAKALVPPTYPRFLYACSLAIALGVTPAAAQENIDSSPRALRMMEAEIAAARMKSRKLRRERVALSHELVALSMGLRELEQELIGYERELASLQAKEKKAQAQFHHYRGETVALTSAMLRFSRVPPEGWLAMPGDMQDILYTAVALKSVTTHMGSQSEQLLQRLETLHQAAKATADAQRQAMEKRAEYTYNRREITAKIARRQELERALQEDLHRRVTHMAALSRRAGDVQSLVTGIEEGASSKAHLSYAVPMPKPAVTALPSPGVRGGVASLRQPSGQFFLPALGQITAHFGEDKPTRIATQGIEINTLEGAEVIAPYDGKIVYTGPFLDYGNIIIIRHDETYHTLIAGLQEITGVPGQQVLRGEPIGRMGWHDEGLTKLYVELRKNAKPVDPLPWIAG